MPTIHLVNGRTCMVCDTLLDLPIERLLAYQVAMSLEASIEAADELRLQQQLHWSVATDELSRLAFAASLEVFEVSAQARAFALLVTHIEQQPVTDFSPEALRERLSWLLALWPLVRADAAVPHPAGPDAARGTAAFLQYGALH